MVSVDGGCPADAANVRSSHKLQPIRPTPDSGTTKARSCDGRALGQLPLYEGPWQATVERPPSALPL